MKLLQGSKVGLSTPDDRGVESVYGPPLYQTVTEFMAKMEDPMDVLAFAKKFVEAIGIYERAASPEGDPLRCIPFVTTDFRSPDGALVFIFKAEESGNTYRIVDVPEPR